MSTQNSQVSAPQRRLFVNSLLASAEEILKSGRKPSHQYHDDIDSAIRGGQDAAWDSFPLARSWFTQMR